jgi:hypothetical protein
MILKELEKMTPEGVRVALLALTYDTSDIIKISAI